MRLIERVRGLGGPRATVSRPEPMLWQWIVAAALLFALWGVALIELSAVFARSSWFITTLVMAAAMLAVGLLLRAVVRQKSLRRTMLVVVIVGFVVWIVSLAIRGRFGAWWTDPKKEAVWVWGRIDSGVAPLKVEGSLEDALLLVVLLVSMATVYLFVRGWWLGSGIVISFLLLLPVAVTGFRLLPETLLVSGVLLALLVWAGSPRPKPAGLLAAGLVIVVTVGVIQLVPDRRDRSWNVAVLFSPVSVTVPDVTVALAEDLRRHSDTIAFKEMGSYPGLQHFTLATLVDFEGGKWLPQFELNEAGDPVTTSRSPSELEQTSAWWDYSFSGFSSTITVKGLRSTWLPLPSGVAMIEGIGEFDEGEWIWVEGSPTARSESSITRDGDQYQVMKTPMFTNQVIVTELGDGRTEIRLPEIKPGFYEGDQNVPESVAPYLALPEGMPDEMRAVAQDAAGSAQNVLDAAGMLEAYFTSGQFAYDEAAPYEPGADPDDPYSVMSAFLDQRSGFCVHYASTFAVLARELGIPTRLSVGYAAEVKPNDRGVEVRGTDLHAWPEIFVEEFGWVAFEPTPGGVGGGAARSSEDTAAQQTKQEEAKQESARTPAETPSEKPKDNVDEAAAEENDGASWGTGLALGLLAAGLLLLLAAPAAVRLTRSKTRAKQIAGGAQPAQQAWAEVIDRVTDLGLLSHATPLRARTPDALIEFLSDQGNLETKATSAMRTLAGLMEAERYSSSTVSRGSRDPQPDASSEAIADCLNEVLRNLDAQVSTSQRITAKLMPRSVLTRRPM